jgi:glycosyltransferase involved in cell wall biosynthesis
MSAALVSIIVPSYQEAATIETILRRVASLPFLKEILVVDDASTDATPQLLRRLVESGELPELRVFTHDRNRGKGAGVRTALARSHGDVVVIQDADLEYDPVDIPRLIGPILDGRADVVYGTRLRGGELQRAHLFWHYAGNHTISLVARVLYNTTLSDVEVGYKAVRGDLMRSLTLTAEDWRIDPELTSKLLRHQPSLRVYELPIAYYGRSYAEGKKITWRDGFAALWTLFHYRFSRPAVGALTPAGPAWAAESTGSSLDGNGNRSARHVGLRGRHRLEQRMRR